MFRLTPDVEWLSSQKIIILRIILGNGVAYKLCRFFSPGKIVQNVLLLQRLRKLGH